MGEGELIIVLLAAAAGLYMAWNIGANDVANAMGTSVGSGALTHRKAVVLAGILEFCGAFLVGAHVTETIRKKMVEPTDFPPEVLMLGMMAALFGAGTWLLIATALGRPVSTTHSIVGAIFGFGLVVGGVDAVQWNKIGEIVLSWIISPALSGIIAFGLFSLIEARIIRSLDPVGAMRRWFPVFTFGVFFIMTLVTIFKGLSNLNLHLTFPMASLLAAGIGLVTALFASWLLSRMKLDTPKSDDAEPPVPIALERGLSDLRQRLDRLRQTVPDDYHDRLARLDHELRELTATSAEPAEAEAEPGLRPELRFVERAFGGLQVLSACFVAFAHGSNDVANAVGPVAAVVAIAHGGQAALTSQAPVPSWVLLLGAVGIVLGLATFGRKVMATIGHRITHLTPSRGFSAEFAAASTIVLASRLGLPVSTTHTLVGGVMGVGFARGIASLNPVVIRDILIAWAIEIPAAALLCVIFYYLLQLVF